MDTLKAFATVVNDMREMGAGYTKMVLNDDDGNISAAMLVMQTRDRDPESMADFGRICTYFKAVSAAAAEGKPPTDPISVGADAVEFIRLRMGEGSIGKGDLKEAVDIVNRAFAAGLAEPNKPCESCGGFVENETCECEEP